LLLQGRQGQLFQHASFPVIVLIGHCHSFIKIVKRLP
jgi:hypothetical protein